MADNTSLNAATGGDLISTDQITTLNGASTASGEKAQRVKVGHGVDGTFNDVSNSTPLPSVEFDAELNLPQGMTVYRERAVAQRYGVLLDSIADGLASFWTQTVTNGGTISVVAGEGLIQSNTATNGTAQLVSTAPAYLPGQSAWMIASARFGDTGVVGNTRRIGAFTVSAGVPQDGFYFELADTTLNAVSAKAGVATAVAVGSWSRVALVPFTPDANYHLFEIRYTGNRADFYIDNVLRHTVSGTTTPITTTLNFPMAVQSLSTSGTTNRIIAVRNIGLGRYGTPDTVIVSSATLAAETTKVIGTVNFAPAQTVATVSTVTAVTAITNALPAGTAILGKIGIDQTTPGTTNAVAVTNTSFGVTQATAANLNATVVGTGTFAVQAAATLAAETTKVIGTVNFSAGQTVATVTTVGAVTAITNALPTGANTIGAITNANLDVLLSTRLKPADTLAAVTTVTTVSAVTAITNALPTGANTIGSVKLTDGTTAAVVKAASTASAATDPSVVVALSPNSPVQQAALTKGTQGATGVTTQDLKDAGRVSISVTTYRAAGIVTTEALFAAATFSNSRDAATATTGVQFTVTAGKRFRIQSIECSIFNNAAAACTSKLVLRGVAAAGTITNASPPLMIWDIGSNSVTTGQYIGPMVLPLPDGFELLPGYAYGFTNLSSAATVLHTISLNGFEY